MTTRVLVVGGAGYVGCVLVPKLLADGYDVGVFDLMLYGAEGLPAHPCLDVIEGDIRDTEHYAAAVEGAEAVINLNLKEQTESVLKTLTPREERVIKMRFGVGDGSEHTLEEVGQNFAVTRERIRQIEAKALRKLRHPSRSRKLRAFLEGRTS